MQNILIIISLLLVVCTNIRAQDDESDFPIIYQIDKETTFFTCAGDFRDGEKNYWRMKSSSSAEGCWRAKVEVAQGEVVVMQDYYPAYNLQNDPKGGYVGHGLVINRSYQIGADTIDNHSVVYKADKDGIAVCDDEFISFRSNRLDEIGEDGYKYSIVIQKYGILSNFTLRPINNNTQSISDWVLERAFTQETTAAEIMWHLTNDLECHAIDTYGQEIDLISTYYSWKVDLEQGTATFTPYFTPRQFKTTWVSGEPFELSLGENVGNKAAKIDDGISYYKDDGKLVLRLWSSGGGIVTPIANVNANATAQDVWYDMFGRKYTTKPTAPGLYIHNGKKEVIR
jgi:hypothetical protein